MKQNRGFWYENIPSGNPGGHALISLKLDVFGKPTYICSASLGKENVFILMHFFSLRNYHFLRSHFLDQAQVLRPV
jgi:hypothetical protein